VSAVAASETKPEWLIARKAYVGGSDAAAIAGLNPYKTPLQTYLDKKGLIEDDAGIFAEMGTYLEPLIKILFTREYGHEVTEAPAHIKHVEYDFLGANPDGFLLDYEGADCLVECKTYDYTTQDEWGEPGTDEIPVSHHCQCQWYMGICGVQTCYVLALHRTSGRFSVYVVQFDQELYEMLVAEAVRFWNENYLADVEPEPEAGDYETIRKRYPTDDGEMMMADNDLEEIAAEMGNVFEEYKPLETRFKMLKTRFMKGMGEASICTTMQGNFTWRTDKNGKRTFKHPFKLTEGEE
jgi:putative phage-type endonuclease